MDKVHERARAIMDEPGEMPGLHELMQALDLILEDDDSNNGSSVNSKPSTEVANTVYRLLIKKEKQKAYESIVSIQTEIYDLQGKTHYPLKPTYSSCRTVSPMHIFA